MRVAVIGAGVVGVTTAYELAVEGHEVVVLERRGSVAVESSFAPAGLASPGIVGPWTGPGVAGQLARSLFGRTSPWRVSPGPRQLAWLWRWWRAGQPAVHGPLQQRLQRLAAYSQERLHGLAGALKLDYERSDGHLVLLRTSRDQARIEPAMAMLSAQGIRHAVLDAAQCLALEPGLNTATALHAGLHLPHDEVGNCRQFTMLLRAEAERLGALFRFHSTVESMQPGPSPRLRIVHSPHEETTSRLSSSGDAATPRAFQPTQPLDEPMEESFDAVVVCAAMGSAELLRPLGLRLPMAAVFGQSVTAPVRHVEAHPDIGPRSAVTDLQQRVVIHRLGSRLRISGGARLGDGSRRHQPEELARLYKVLDDWFPGAARRGHAQRWSGARPMLPDGAPVIGASGVTGVWLNLAHGAGGWALACGSARLIADGLGGRTPGLDVTGLGVERLRA